MLFKYVTDNLTKMLKLRGATAAEVGKPEKGPLGGLKGAQKWPPPSQGHGQPRFRRTRPHLRLKQQLLTLEAVTETAKKKSYVLLFRYQDFIPFQVPLDI